MTRTTLAILVEVSTITLKVFAIGVTTEIFIKVEVISTLSDSFPISIASTVEEWKFQVSDSISLEVSISPLPSSDLSTKEVSNSL